MPAIETATGPVSSSLRIAVEIDGSAAKKAFLTLPARGGGSAKGVKTGGLTRVSGLGVVRGILVGGVLGFGLEEV